MSSHHIVREGQEPALIIANGQECSSELLGQLLERSPYTVVLDGALHRVEKLGIRMDALLGDFDSVLNSDNVLNIEELIRRYHPVEVVETADQEKTDLEKAILWLHRKGFAAANIVWAGGKRADHFFHNISILPMYSKLMDLVMIDDHSRIFPVQSGYRKFYPAGTVLSLVPIGRVEGIRTSNLQYPLNNEALFFPGRPGTSNAVLEDGIVEIHWEHGELLLMECRD